MSKQTSSEASAVALASRAIVAGTTRDRIRGVPTAWRRQYGNAPADPRWAEVLRRLDALDRETASAADVEAIIGNTSWTRQSCDVCDLEVEAWVRIGAEPDYESSTAYVCGDCLSEALRVYSTTSNAAQGVAPKDLPSGGSDGTGKEPSERVAVPDTEKGAEHE